MLPSDRLNWANAILMIASCAAAVALPFHLFLFSYAILGPLHYLTEVSWLHDREFFTPRRGHRRMWVALVMATTMAMLVGYVATEWLDRPIRPTFEIGMFLLVFLAAAVASFVAHPVNAIAIASVAIVAILLFSPLAAYGIVAYLLITIVHVFVFTAMFLLAGALKTRSRSGYWSLAIFIACALATVLVSAPFLAPSGQVREIYRAFEQLNLLLLRLGSSPLRDVYDPAAVGVMRFVAFAYTYHYLNWFSKTSLIRWHAIPARRGLAILGIWLAGIGLYFYDYRIGFAVFYLLSVLHVMLEFPLNHQTMVTLARALLPSRASTARG